MDSSVSFPLRRVCLFCGALPGNRSEYQEVAARMARLLAERGIGIVYGGALNGLMGIVADAALAAGGEVIGVLPHSMAAREIGHTGLTQLHLVETMHERKTMMANLSDGFVALPGGMGTFEEFCEVVSWAQVGLHHKPCGILNVAGFYDGFLTFLDHAVAEGFLRTESRALVLTANTPEALLEQFVRYRPPTTDRWSTTVSP